jgi:signal transduction histidine kinase/FixJ family two-component response regulator
MSEARLPSDQAQTQQALSLLQEQEDTQGELLLHVDPAGNYTVDYCNGTAERMFGISRVDISGIPMPWDKIPFTLAEYLHAALQQSMQGPRDTLPLLELHGTPTRAFSVTVRNHHVEQDKLHDYWFYFVFSDVSSMLSLQEEVMNARRMESIGALAGGVAHDFNNLIMAIQGHSEFLLTLPNLPEQVSESMERIIRACASGTALTRSLLGYARKQKLSMDRMMLADLVQELAGLCQRSYGPKVQIEVSPELANPSEADYKSGRLMIHGCYSALSHSLLNILNNSRDAMAAGGKITIRSENTDDHVSLLISDTGDGMHQDVLDRVFEPFFTTKPKGKGTGLGLPMVQGIMHQHGGDVAIESEMGKGTTVRLIWPVYVAGEGEASYSPKVSTSSVPPPAPTGKRLAFLIEDEPMVMASITKLLQMQRFDVRGFSDAAEALAELRQGEIPHVMVVDYSMPGMDGVEFIRHAFAFLQEQNKLALTRIVLASGYPPDHFEKLSLEMAGLTLNILQKPFSSETLAKLIGQKNKKFMRRITSRIKVDSI